MFVSFNIKKQTLDRFNHCPSQIQHVEHYQDISSSTLRSSSQKRSLKTTASRNNNNNNYNTTGNDNIKLKEVHISFKKILHFFTIISLSFMSRNFFSFFFFFPTFPREQLKPTLLQQPGQVSHQHQRKLYSLAGS